MSARPTPRWVTAIQRRLATKPEITSLRCTACGRLVAPKDWARDYCRDCDTERSAAFEMDDSPFLEDE